MKVWKWIGFMAGAGAGLLLELLLMPFVLALTLAAFVASFFKEKQ